MDLIEQGQELGSMAAKAGNWSSLPRQVKLPDQRSGLPGKEEGHFKIASLNPDQRSELAGSRPVKTGNTLAVAVQGTTSADP